MLRALSIALLCLTGALACAAELVPVPPLKARVTDQTGTLTAQEQGALEQKLAALEARKGAQLAVLLVPTTQPEAIEQYALRVAEAWKLGREKPDDGALLLLAREDRALRIEVGYGLEGALTDATSNRIIEETMVPLLRQGSYAAAVNAGVDQMIRVIDGEPLPPPDQSWQRGSERIWELLPFLLVMFLVVSSVLRAIFGRVFGSALTGGATGGVVWLLSQILPMSIGLGVVGFVIALLMGLGGGRWTTGSHRGGGWYGGSGGGFGGGFGGGSGGFGGGGGGFGGGGASGRW